MKRSLIIVAFTFFAALVSPVVSAQSIEEATRVELTHVANLLFGYTYMSLWGGQLDAAVAGAGEAILVARMAGDVALERRAENNKKAYRAFALISTAEVAGQRGYHSADAEIKKLGCRMLTEVSPQEWLTPIVETAKEFCARSAPHVGSVDTTKLEMLKVSAALLIDATDTVVDNDPSSSIGSATAALDIADAAGRTDLIQQIREMIFSYEVMSLMRTAMAFEEEKVNTLAAGRIRALACQMIGGIAPQLLPTLEKFRLSCSI